MTLPVILLPFLVRRPVVYTFPTSYTCSDDQQLDFIESYLRWCWVCLTKREFTPSVPKISPSCHSVKVLCDNLPHPFCAHWMQHYAALWNYYFFFFFLSWDTFKYTPGLHISCILWLFLMLTSHFFVSPPFHPLTHLFFVASMCPSVCWLPVFCVVFVLRLFCLWCPRCVCALPRRRSFHGSCGPCCWCICWIWWVTKQLNRVVCEQESVCQSACFICYLNCFCFLKTVE